MELTLVIIKPDGMPYKNMIGERLALAGLIAPEIMTGAMPPQVVRWLYSHLLERDGGEVIVQRIEAYFAEGETSAAIIGGRNAIAKVRQLIGDTDPLVATPGSIRADFSSDSLELAIQEGRALRNVIHASSSLLDAVREVSWMLASSISHGKDPKEFLAPFKLQDEEVKLWIERAEAF